MMKKFVGAATVAAWAVSGAAFAQSTTQDKPKDTTIVIKDDAGAKSKQAAQKTENAARKTGEAISDASITTEVKTRLMKDKAARATSIDVTTRDGVVSIAGHVPTATDKTRIGQLVEKTTGVKSVVNNLTINRAAGTSGVAVKDDSGKVAVKTKGDDHVTLKSHDDDVKVKTDDTKVVVKDDAGGKAKTAANKTGHAAKRAGETVTDASITTAVKTHLMKDSVARGTSIDVSTTDGVVTISGAVPTAADKARIGQLVEKTTGVKSVNNELTVK